MRWCSCSFIYSSICACVTLLSGHLSLHLARANARSFLFVSTSGLYYHRTRIDVTRKRVCVCVRACTWHVSARAHTVSVIHENHAVNELQHGRPVCSRPVTGPTSAWLTVPLNGHSIRFKNHQLSASASVSSGREGNCELGAPVLCCVVTRELTERSRLARTARAGN